MRLMLTIYKERTSAWNRCPFFSHTGVLDTNTSPELFDVVTVVCTVFPVPPPDRRFPDVCFSSIIVLPLHCFRCRFTPHLCLQQGFDVG